MEEKLMSIGTYVDPFVIKVLLCDSINNEIESILNYEQVKEYVKNAKVNLKKEDIAKFLDEELDRNFPDLRYRVKKDNYSNPVDRLMDKLKFRKYMCKLCIFSN